MQYAGAKVKSGTSTLYTVLNTNRYFAQKLVLCFEALELVFVTGIMKAFHPCISCVWVSVSGMSLVWESKLCGPCPRTPVK